MQPIKFEKEDKTMKIVNNLKSIEYYMEQIQRHIDLIKMLTIKK